MAYEFEKLEARQLLSATPNGPQAIQAEPLDLDGSPFYLKLDGDGQTLDVYANSTGDGAPAQQIPTDQISVVNVDDGGQPNSVTIDFSNGSPLPAMDLNSVGGGTPTTNQLTLIGTNGNDTIVVNSNQITFNDIPITYSNFGQVIFTPGNGLDELAVNSGSLELIPPSGAGVVAESFSNISIADGASLMMIPAAVRSVLVTNGLSISQGGKLDLTSNDMLLRNSPAGDVNTPGTVANELKTGFNAGQGYWNGQSGIVSSSAAGDTSLLTTVGYCAGGSSFDGLATSASDTELKYTYYGDADLNGTINGADFQQIDLGFGSQKPGWSNGDFNQDGVVNGSDYALLDNAFNQISATGATLPASPLLILPGSGFNGPTVPDPNVQHVDPSQPFSNDMAIANWDVVPYQTFSGQFNVGVVAFHSNGIKEVDFSVNGGAWVKVTKMTLNSQTANTSGIGNQNKGVVEYWATLDAHQFLTDGQIEVRAVAYPMNGQARVLTSLMLNANAHHTLPALALYVSPTGSDSAGTGTATSPFASIARAANYYTNNTSIDGVTIYLTAGNYQLTSVAYQYPNTSTAWLTVMPAPGVDRSKVIISGNGGALTNNWGLRTALMHFEGLTFAPLTAQSQSIFRSTDNANTSLWIDGCVLIGPGPTIDAGWTTSILSASIYLTDTSESLCRDGIAGCLVRGVSVANIGSDAFSGSEMVINSSATGTNDTGTSFHPDVYQFYAPVGVTIDNVILYGVTGAVGAPGGGQGFFSGNNVSIKDVAFVNCNINTQQPPSYGTAFGFGGPTANMYVLRCTFTGPALWRTDFAFVASDVVLDQTVFSSPPKNLLGVTVK